MQPGRIATNKWTKLGPGFDFFSLGMCVSSALLAICRGGLSALTVVYENSVKQAEQQMGNLEETKRDSLNFHIVAGMRRRRLFRMLESQEKTFSIVVFTVVGEVSRAMGFWFMQAAEGRLRNGRPYLMELTSPSTSPVTVCCQYLSGLLAGHAGAARVVWQRHGRRSMKHWAATQSNEASGFRRAVLAMAAKMSRRHSVGRSHARARNA